jgi:hypothetical protein
LLNAQSRLIAARPRLLTMEDPETYLRALTAPLAWMEEGSSLPVTRFSLEAVANAFVVLGLLPAQRAEEILAAQRPIVEAAGFRVGLPIGELSVDADARAFQEARTGAPNGPRLTPLAVGAGPVRFRLAGHDITITSVTLTPEGIWVRYYGDAQEGDRSEAGAIAGEVTDEITEVSMVDDTGRTYLVSPDNVRGHAYGHVRRRSESGRPLWIPAGDFLVVPTSGEAAAGAGRPGVRWLEFSAGSGEGTGPVRVEIRPPAAVPTGTAEPAWPTPAEAYLAELAPVYHWSIGSFETGSVDLDAPEIVATVAGALLAVGALPPGSALLEASQYRERRPARADWQTSVKYLWVDGARERMRRAGHASGAGLAVPLPLQQAVAVVENISAYEDLVSVQLYGHPWVARGSFPTITPNFRVTAVDDTGVQHEGMPDGSSHSHAYDGTGSFWFWPPVPTQAKQLRVIVSTLWEAAWALIDIPGR